MWVKKSPEELRKPFSKKRRLLGALAIGTIIFLGCVFTNGGVVGYVRTGVFFKRHIYEMVDSIPSALLTSLIVGLIAYRFLFSENPPPQDTLMCPMCEKTKFDDGSYSCSCGGHFEDIGTMKWVEEKAP